MTTDQLRRLLDTARAEQQEYRRRLVELDRVIESCETLIDYLDDGFLVEPEPEDPEGELLPPVDGHPGDPEVEVRIRPGGPLDDPHKDPEPPASTAPEPEPEPETPDEGEKVDPEACPPCHYVYEDQNGPTAVGVCKKCGAETVGFNSMQHSNWSKMPPGIIPAIRWFLSDGQPRTLDEIREFLRERSIEHQPRNVGSYLKFAGAVNVGPRTWQRSENGQYDKRDT